jgi:iron complex transport system substrate-binding protein
MKNRHYFLPGHPRVLTGLLCKRSCVGLYLLFLYLIGCQATDDNSAYNRQEDDTAHPSDPSWAKKLEIRYARGFDISYFEDYKLLQLFQGSDTTLYLLLPQTASRPDIYPEAQVIRTPISELVALSTTHIALADFVNADSIIIGLDNPAYVYNPRVRKRVDQGEITTVGEGGSLNQEMVIALQPDLLMVSGMPGTDLQKYQSIIQSGIPVLINTEWMEQTPLGKAEWVKLMAALTNREALVSAKYDTLANEYQRIAALTDKLDQRPSIVSGSPFQGSWYVPGAKSYRAKLYQQAGAQWPWSVDSSAVSIPVAFENMYAYGLEADYWLNPGMVNSLHELREKDARFADFKSFQQGQVYNHNRRLTPDSQGNDFFESGMLNPQRVLADLTYILHPELLPGHDLYYYQKLD